MKNPVFLSFLLVSFASAETKLSSLFSDHMVLQQKQVNPIWGWDDPDTGISVKIAGQSHKAKAGEDGRWEVRLSEMPARARRQKLMNVSGTCEVSVRDILVGEVWLCSGQSNMAWTVNNSFGQELTKLSVDLPQIGTQEMTQNFNGKWEVFTAHSVGNFSAVGYHFGKTLHEILGVPIGLINYGHIWLFSG